MLGRRLAAGSLACLFGVFCIPASVAADVAGSYAELTAVRGLIATAAADRFGGAWRKDMFKAAISAELVGLDRTAAELKDQSDELVSRHTSLRSDRDLLQPKVDANTRLVSALAAKRSDLEQRGRALAAASADLQTRIERHNANRCRAPADNPGACAAYDAEKRSLEGEQQDIRARLTALSSDDDDLTSQETAAQQDAIALASQDRALDQRAAVVQEDEDAFVRRCDEATARARALLEVMRNPHQDVLSDAAEQRRAGHAERVRERDEMSASFATAVGSGAMGGLVKALAREAGGTAATTAETLALAGSRAVAGSAAIALPVADVVGIDMDQRSTEVANNTYLLGAYGAALVNLKREGRLRPGDKGYDALRAMSTKLGGESPGSGAEFTLQSLTLTRSAMRNAVQGLAVELTPTPGERVADGFVESIMTRRIARSSAKMAAVSVGHGVAEEYVKTLQHDYFMKQPLKWISDSVEQRSRQAAQDALEHDAR